MADEQIRQSEDRPNWEVCSEINKRIADEKRKAPINGGLVFSYADYGMLTSRDSYGCHETPKNGVVREHKGFAYERNPYSSFIVSRAANSKGEQIDVPGCLSGTYTDERLLIVEIDKFLSGC